MQYWKFVIKNVLLVLGFAITMTVPVSAYEIITDDSGNGEKWFDVSLARSIFIDENGLDSVNDGGNNGVNATINAIDVWNQTVGDSASLRALVAPESSGTVSSSISTNDGISMLDFSGAIGICTGSCLAATTIGIFTTDDPIVENGITWNHKYDSDIFFNTRQNFTTVEEESQEGESCVSFPPKKAEVYLEGVIVHEVGHLLGLGHSLEGNATMYPSVSSCNKDHAVLDDDDINGINCIYGSGTCGVSAPPTPPPSACTGSNVATITHQCPSNGRNAMTFDVSVKCDDSPVEGVDVNIEVVKDCILLTGIATTGSDGKVKFRVTKNQATTGIHIINAIGFDGEGNGSVFENSCEITNASVSCN